MFKGRENQINRISQIEMTATGGQYYTEYCFTYLEGNESSNQ